MSAVATLQDVERLRELYTAGLHDAFLDSALRKIIDRQITHDEANLKRINKVLTQFESQYGMSSDDFWQRFQAGQMDDTAEFMEWNVFCKMRQRITTRLRILRGNNIHE